MCVLLHQDHHDRLHGQTDEQGSVSQLVGGRHRQDSKLQLGPIQGDTLSPCQVEAVFRFSFFRPLRNNVPPLFECAFRTSLINWLVPWPPASTATSTSRRPFSACCWVAWRRCWRMDPASEGTSTSCSLVIMTSLAKLTQKKFSGKYFLAVIEVESKF